MASASHPAGLTLAKYIDLLVAQGYIERGPSAAAPATKGRMQATQRTQRGSGSDRIEGGDAAIRELARLSALKAFADLPHAQSTPGVLVQKSKSENRASLIG